MTAILVTVASAIYDELANLTLSESFTRYRSYGDWEDLLDDLSTTLRIDVVPNTCQSELFDRGSHLYECNVSILLRKRIPVGDRTNGKINNSVIDKYIEDLQEIHEYFAPSQPNLSGLRLASVQQARWLPASGIKAPYSRKVLREHGQYSGWLNVVYGYPRQFGT